MRSCLLSILLVSSAFAQLPLMVGDPAFVGVYQSAQTPIQLATVNAAERWVFTDLSSNSAISGGWTGRISGWVWKQGASSNQPTNSSLGVWLDSTHFLTNSTIFVASNCTFGVVWKIIDTGHFANQLQDGFLYSRLPSTACGCNNEIYIGFAGTSSGVSPLCFQCGAPACYLAASPDPYAVTNVVSDMIMSQALTNTGSIGRLYCWTNNVVTALAADNETFNAGSGNNGYWGYGNTNQPQTLGKNAFRNQGPLLYLDELWMWTNNIGSIGVLITDSIRTNWHAAMTNLYGYSP